jgi:hypothetical protein
MNIYSDIHLHKIIQENEILHNKVIKLEDQINLTTLKYQSIENNYQKEH